MPAASRSTSLFSILPDSYRTHGEILLQRGRLDLAETLIRQSLALLEEYTPSDSFFAGYAWRALVYVYLAQGDEGAAIHAREQAVECFRGLGMQHEVNQIPLVGGDL
jgi:tetratricopeptide (TPR) repeat protein